MVPATLGLGHPVDYQTDRPWSLFVKGVWGSGAGNLWLIYFQMALWSSTSRGECRKLGVGGGSGGSPGGSMGLPYITSKDLSPRGFLGKARTLRRTNGKSLVQSRYTPRVSLVRVSLVILFILSTFPEDWGCYGM